MISVDRSREEWFLEIKGARSGPFSAEQIEGLLKEGEILPHHPVFCERLGNSSLTANELVDELHASVGLPKAREIPVPGELEFTLEEPLAPEPEPVPSEIHREPVNEPQVQELERAEETEEFEQAEEVAEELLVLPQVEEPTRETASAVAPVVVYSNGFQPPARPNMALLDPLRALQIQIPVSEPEPPPPAPAPDPTADLFNVLQTAKLQRQASAAASLAGEFLSEEPTGIKGWWIRLPKLQKGALAGLVALAVAAAVWNLQSQKDVPEAKVREKSRAASQMSSSAPTSSTRPQETTKSPEIPPAAPYRSPIGEITRPSFHPQVAHTPQPHPDRLHDRRLDLHDEIPEENLDDDHRRDMPRTDGAPAPTPSNDTMGDVNP